MDKSGLKDNIDNVDETNKMDEVDQIRKILDKITDIYKVRRVWELSCGYMNKLKQKYVTWQRVPAIVHSKVGYHRDRFSSLYPLNYKEENGIFYVWAFALNKSYLFFLCPFCKAQCERIRAIHMVENEDGLLEDRIIAVKRKCWSKVRPEIEYLYIVIIKCASRLKVSI